MARSGSARDIVAPDFATTPLWWLDAPPDAAAGDPLPERVDVAVIGTGYCGLSSALELARAGTRVAALDQGAPGAGASTPNGGMVGGAVRLDWQDLARRFGRKRAATLADGARLVPAPREPDRARAARCRLPARSSESCSIRSRASEGERWIAGDAVAGPRPAAPLAHVTAPRPCGTMRRNQ